MTPRPRSRKTYRHGDLRRTLVAAGVELARESGPEAVILREATRRAGVVPNAAYRHFDNHAALLDAVRDSAVASMAITMEAQLRALGPAREEAGYARAALRAVGAGYLRFAREETGLFRTAFLVRVAPSPANPDKAGASGLNPFQLLTAALDRMVRCRVLPKSRRPGAEYLAWSAVHGMAMLLIDGPLVKLPNARFNGLALRLLEMVEKGI